MYGLKFVNFDKLDLGKEYLVHFNWNMKGARRCKLIKVTAKGYNFLDIERNKCILKKHLYVNKSGSICLVKAFKISNFELKMEAGVERFVNIESLIK